MEVEEEKEDRTTQERKEKEEISEEVFVSRPGVSYKVKRVTASIVLTEELIKSRLSCFLWFHERAVLKGVSKWINQCLNDTLLDRSKKDWRGKQLELFHPRDLWVCNQVWITYVLPNYNESDRVVRVSPKLFDLKSSSSLLFSSQKHQTEEEEEMTEETKECHNSNNDDGYSSCVEWIKDSQTRFMAVLTLLLFGETLMNSMRHYQTYDKSALRKGFDAWIRSRKDSRQTRRTKKKNNDDDDDNDHESEGDSDPHCYPSLVKRNDSGEPILSLDKVYVLQICSSMIKSDSWTSKLVRSYLQFSRVKQTSITELNFDVECGISDSLTLFQDQFIRPLQRYRNPLTGHDEIYYDLLKQLNVYDSIADDHHHYSKSAHSLSEMVISNSADECSRAWNGRCPLEDLSFAKHTKFNDQLSEQLFGCIGIWLPKLNSINLSHSNITNQTCCFTCDYYLEFGLESVLFVVDFTGCSKINENGVRQLDVLLQFDVPIDSKNNLHRFYVEGCGSVSELSSHLPRKDPGPRVIRKDDIDLTDDYDPLFDARFFINDGHFPSDSSRMAHGEEVDGYSPDHESADEKPSELVVTHHSSIDPRLPVIEEERLEKSARDGVDGATLECGDYSESNEPQSGLTEGEVRQMMEEFQFLDEDGAEVDLLELHRRQQRPHPNSDRLHPILLGLTYPKKWDRRIVVNASEDPSYY